MTLLGCSANSQEQLEVANTESILPMQSESAVSECTETVVIETMPEQWLVDEDMTLSTIPAESQHTQETTEPSQREEVITPPSIETTTTEEPATQPSTEPVPTEYPGYGIDLPDDIWES